jgi:uncharacterized membrane protein
MSPVTAGGTSARRQAMTGTQGGPVLFEAVIVPHRSLTLAGLRILLGAVLVSCVASAVVFAALGAWPVGLFALAELVLAALLFHLHMRAARASELLLLTSAGLRIVHTSAGGTVRIRDLPADWMGVRLEERPGRVPALLLRTRGASVEVGQELGEVAKRSLAEALAEALERRRSPVFDNPQLR